MSNDKFGRYEIKGEIGRGGMATVYHAYDPRFERDVAIKVLPREFLHDPQFRTRFEREAKTVALLEHPAIVPVYDFGEEEGQPYIVMRYMAGGSLSEKLSSGPISIRETSQMISRIAQALDVAHARGIIHRDLKPGNILFDQYGNAFLSDFGIARLQETTTVTLTGGAILGTPAYMSPEQVQGGVEIDGRSDIYSLGVILYQALTGQIPYQADTPAKLMMMHLLEPVPRIHAHKSELPEIFDFIIEKAMAKDREHRYNAAEQMATDVEIAARSTLDVTPISGQSPDPGVTLISAGKTVVAPTATKLAATESNLKPASVTQPQVSPTPALLKTSHSKIRRWAWLIGGLAGIILLVMGGVLLRSITPKQAPSIASVPSTTSTATLPISTKTSTPNPTVAPTTAIPSQTIASSATPSQSSTPTNEPEPPTPTLNSTETPEPLPAIPVVGGADKIAFLKDNDIWLVNLDGSDLIQLTDDGGSKTELQWTPDGSGIVYISGLCIQRVTIENRRIDNLACFEYLASLDEFEISPDGNQIAISINQQLYIVPMDLEQLSQVGYWSDIQAMAECKEMAPWASNTGAPYAVRQVIWSKDMQTIAVVVLGVEADRQVEMGRVLDVSQCIASPRRLDEFPASRFTITTYNDNPLIRPLGWDGVFNFVMTGYTRNGGFGDLYFYNYDLHRAQIKINPIDGACCYRDPSFSPDGSYVIFAFQDIRQGAQGQIQIYYIPYGTLGTGLKYQPLPLPADFFTNPKESPQPILHPAS